MKTLLLAMVALFLVSCSTQWNRRNAAHQKIGWWKETLYTQNGPLNGTGRYRKGEKVGNWKFYYGDTKYEIDRYRGNKTKTKVFHPNGRVAEKGISQTLMTNGNVDWHRIGKWQTFNADGKIKDTFDYNKNDEKIYDMGELDPGTVDKAASENFKKLMGIPPAKDTLKKGH